MSKIDYTVKMVIVILASHRIKGSLVEVYSTDIMEYKHNFNAQPKHFILFRTYQHRANFTTWLCLPGDNDCTLHISYLFCNPGNKSVCGKIDYGRVLIVQ